MLTYDRYEYHAPQTLGDVLFYECARLGVHIIYANRLLVLGVLCFRIVHSIYT